MSDKGIKVLIFLMVTFILGTGIYLINTEINKKVTNLSTTLPTSSSTTLPTSSSISTTPQYNFSSFGLTHDLNGTNVAMGTRDPHTSGSSVMCWTHATPIGRGSDQEWSYNSTTGLLINRIRNLPVKSRTDNSLILGSSSTDGDVLSINVISGKYQFKFSDGSVIGINTGNYAGGIYTKNSQGALNINSFFTMAEVN